MDCETMLACGTGSADEGLLPRNAHRAAENRRRPEVLPSGGRTSFLTLGLETRLATAFSRDRVVTSPAALGTCSCSRRLRTECFIL